MKKLAMMMLALSVSGCVSGPTGSLEGYCVASEAGIKAHAAALSVTADEAVLRTGDLVIRQRDAGCAS